MKRDVTFIRSDDIPNYEVFEEKVDEMFEEGENGKSTCKVCGLENYNYIHQLSSDVITACFNLVKET